MVDVGTQIGSYLIERVLGEGGFGVVYVGVDQRLRRRAAIKQLHPYLSTNHEMVQRFFNEARAAASINHPGIVEIYDVGWHTDGSAYFVMKLLDGDSLAKRMQTNRMPVQLAATIARQISSALVAAHEKNIVHRDLKPANVVLVRDREAVIGERAIVLDFGIAKLLGDQASHQTKTGMVMGTPLYMSPEQCHGASAVDHRTDVYALGCILFELLTGRPPFVGEGAGDILGKHQYVDPPSVRSLRPEVPVELETIVMCTLAKKPEQRFQQMSEFAAALQPFGAGRSMEHAAQVEPSPNEYVVPESSPRTVRSETAVAPKVATTLSEARGEVAGKEPSQRGKLALVIGVVAMAITAGVAFILISSSSNRERSREGQSSGSGSGAALSAGSWGSGSVHCSVDGLNCPSFSTQGLTGRKLHKLVFDARNEKRHAEVICLAQHSINSDDKWLVGASHFEASYAWERLGCRENAVSAIEASLDVRPSDKGGWKETCDRCSELNARCEPCHAAATKRIACPSNSQLAMIVGDDMRKQAPSDTTWTKPKVEMCIPIGLPQSGWYVIGWVEQESPDREFWFHIAVDAQSSRILAISESEQRKYNYICETKFSKVDDRAGAPSTVSMRVECADKMGNTGGSNLEAEIVPPKIVLHVRK